jgi:maltooligosyltrehalose trehalohydrolase
LEQPEKTQLIVPMKKGVDGMFAAEIPQARPGDLYRYRVEGHNVYPDPASRFQPEGVHGPSQIVDPKHFPWTDAQWRGIPAEDLIIYELHVGTFSPEGTYEGLIRRLPHLVQLGVTAIELMPLADFPGLRNWGYDGVCPYAPARCYGSPDELRQLVNASHRAGLAVIVDAVYNHLGPDGNYTGVFSPFYTTSNHKTDWGQGMNFDGERSVHLREFFIQNALHWIHEYHMDGLRLDATHAMADNSARHFLAELVMRVKESTLGRRVHIIAEDNRNLATLIRPESEGGFGLTAVWADDFHHQVRRIAAGDHDGYYVDYSDQVEDLVETINKGWFYQGQPSVFLKGPRGTTSEGLPPHQFVFCIQNHDQVGNRAFGDRLHHQIDAPTYRAVSTLLLSAPETPLLFMGQEWATRSPFLYFTDHDEELGKAVREGRKEEFKSFLTFSGAQDLPDPQAPDTFRRSKLVWTEKLKEPHTSMWQFYQALIQWRRSEFGFGSPHSKYKAVAADKGTVLIRRTARDGGEVLIVVRLKGAGVIDLALHPDVVSTNKPWHVIITSEEKTYAPEPSAPVVHLTGPAPKIEFARPGAVILKEGSHLV